MKKIILLCILFITPLAFAQFNIGQPDDIIIVENPFDGLATFDLTINENQTLNGLSPSVVTISYFNSEADANVNVNQIPNPESFINAISPQTIYVRMQLNNNPDSYQVASFNILVEDDLILGTVTDLVFYQIPLTNTATFDLTEKNSEILNGIDPSIVSIQFFNSQADADLNTFAISSPENYTNVTNPETIFVRVDLLSDSNIYSTTSFNLGFSDDVVNIPDPNFLQSIIFQGVDINNSGNIQSFEALAATSLSIDELVTNTTGLEAFSNLTELTSSIPLYASFDLSLLPLLEVLEIFVPLGGSQTPLDLSNNPNLKTLRLSNTGVSDLDVSNNLLLEELEIWGSTLTTLDLNNCVNLTSLSLFGNQLLETVFIKNGADESTNVNPGNWLEMWSPSNHPALEYVCADDFQVTEIQQWAGTSYAVNALCSTAPGGNYNTISGTTQFDFNNDGCDSSDPIIPNLMVEVGPGPSTVVPGISSDGMGVYNYYVGQPGNYTLQPALENPSYFNINPNFPLVNVPAIDGNTTTQDFCLTPSGSIPDAEVVISPIVPSNPGFDATYKLLFKNKGNQALSGNVNFQYDDSILDFVSSTLTPDVQNTGELIFNFTNLLPFESRSVEVTLNVNGPTENPAVNIDDVLEFIATVNTDQNEETPEDNVFTYKEIVVGSYDPNDITCLQGDMVSDAEIGEFLHYKIRFENTGTAPAQQVVVTTAINPADYTINTLQVLDASHDMFVRNNNGVIEFVFEDIQLPANGGQGDILLKIKTLSTLTINDEVDIQADIYFDFNFPIVTNVANTSFETLSVSGLEGEEDISLYPNPVEDILFIESKHDLNQISLFDIQGKQIKVNVNLDQGGNTRIDLSHLSQGIYFINIKTPQGDYSKKVIKD